MNNIKTPEELLKFMSENIRYGYLGKNGKVYQQEDEDFDSSWYDQYVLENKDDILKNLCGNCFDQVELERYWFLENGYTIKTIYEMVKLDYDNKYPTHSFLVYNDNNSWYWFENADSNNRGIHRFNTFEELISFQYKKYVENLKQLNITDNEIENIILTEFNKPNEHISAKEYINHLLNSKRIIIDEKGEK